MPSMPIRALADTGALLAYLDRADRWHERCRAAFTELRLPLITIDHNDFERYRIGARKRFRILPARF